MAASASEADGAPPPEDFPKRASDYEMGDVIGSGGFANVYRGRCLTNGQPVAIKIIKLNELQTPLETIMNEVRTMALCRHKNVLPLHAAFTDESDLWLVTPLMNKGSAFWVQRMVERLGKAPPSQPRLPEDVIRAILRRSLEGLAYLHDKKHIHRDIKAGNILLDSEGRVMIGDFGVSGWMSDGAARTDGRRDTFVGTPCWMAPEVMEQAKGYNERADVWSLGITALELAMGTAPYASMQPMQVLLETLNKAPPTLKTYESAGMALPEVSSQFKKFVARCLVKDAAKRPSAAELLKLPYMARATDDALLATLASIGEVGPETAAAVDSKPGYAPKRMERLKKVDEFAMGTTWVLWEGGGSVAPAAGVTASGEDCTEDTLGAELAGITEIAGAGEAATEDFGRSAMAERRASGSEPEGGEGAAGASASAGAAGSTGAEA